MARKTRESGERMEGSMAEGEASDYIKDKELGAKVTEVQEPLIDQYYRARFEYALAVLECEAQQTMIEEKVFELRRVEAQRERAYRKMIHTGNLLRSIVPSPVELSSAALIGALEQSERDIAAAQDRL